MFLAWRPSWSCDMDHLYNLSFTFSTRNLAKIGQAVSEKKMFENNGHIHVFSPGAGTDNPKGNLFLNIFINTNFQSI